MAAKFEIYQDASSQYRFRLKAGNGENILGSEAYTGKDGCKNGIASVQKNSGDEGRYEMLTAKNGKSYFNLKAKNGQVIGTSQMYASESGAKNGVASVMKNGSTTNVDDLS
jgi:uncharacterized protein YegP (UPF0339 family)